MQKSIIKKKLYNVNKWVQESRANKDWDTYEKAVKEYNRLLQLYKNL